MKHSYGLSILAVCVTLVASPVFAQDGVFPISGQFDQVTTVTAPRFMLRYVQSVSFKGRNIRVDKTDLRQLIPLTQIETPGTMDLYSTVSGTGEESPIANNLPPLLDRMATDTKSKLSGATMSGKGTFEGYKCDIYKTTTGNGAEQIELWVNEDPKFPFTLKTIATDQALNKVTVVTLENIVLNEKLDDSFFQVPATIKIAPPSAAPQSGSADSTPAPTAPATQSTPTTGATGSKP